MKCYIYRRRGAERVTTIRIYTFQLFAHTLDSSLTFFSFFFGRHRRTVNRGCKGGCQVSSVHELSSLVCWEVYKNVLLCQGVRADNGQAYSSIHHMVGDVRGSEILRTCGIENAHLIISPFTKCSFEPSLVTLVAPRSSIVYVIQNSSR
jgi:hypothetical protein